MYSVEGLKYDLLSPNAILSVIPKKGSARRILSDRLMEVTFTDSAKLSDSSVDLTLRNDDRAVFFDEKLSRKGTAIGLKFGYPGLMVDAGEFTINKHSGSKDRVKLKCGSRKRGRMAREKETRVWSDARRSDAVSDVLQRHFPRNKIDVEATDKILESITQRGEHDWQFCQRQAQLAQYDLFIDEDGAHFIKPRRGESPARTLRYVDNPINAGHIIDFNHDGVGKGLPGKITLKGRDPVTKKSFSISVTPDTADDIGELVEPAWVETPEEGDENERGDAGQEITRNTGAKTEAEARELATSMLKAARWSAMELSLTLLGDPTVRSRRVVAVWGLGQSMDGLWWSTEVQHTLGRGYVTKVKLAREGLAKRLAPAAVKAARKAKKEIEDAAATAMGALYGYTQGY